MEPNNTNGGAGGDVNASDQPVAGNKNDLTQNSTDVDSSKAEKKPGTSKTVLILGIVIALLIGGGIGYVVGTNKATSDVEAKFEQQVQSLEKDLEAAKKNISSELTEGQEAVQEGQQTLSSLQAENAELKAQIEELNQKIADLEKQLEEASDTTAP